MGQSLIKLTSGAEEDKSKLNEIAERYWEQFSKKDFLSNKDYKDDSSKFKGLKDSSNQLDYCDLTDFYRGVCEAVEDVNSSAGYTQFRVPKEDVLEKAFKKHHPGKGKSLSKEEFQKILQDVIMETGFTGIGAKDVILYIFGVPATAFLIKKGILPRAIPDEFFIPAVTSATVFALSKFNKI